MIESVINQGDFVKLKNGWVLIVKLAMIEKTIYAEVNDGVANENDLIAYSDLKRDGVDILSHEDFNLMCVADREAFGNGCK